MRIEEEQKRIEEIIGKVEDYCLINNYGFVKGKYDIRHVLNVYGAECNIWDLTNRELIGQKGCSESFSNFEDLLKRLEKIKEEF